MQIAEQARASRGTWLKRAPDARNGTAALHARIITEITDTVG
jgi:hypothetical protein